MNSSRRTLLLSFALSFVALTTTQAQQAPLAPRRVLISPGSSQAPSGQSLSTNYRITLAANASGQKVGELSLLTAEPEIQLLGSFDARNISSVSLTATLMEQDGNLMLRFRALSANVPLDTEVKPAVASPQGVPVAPQVHRHKEISAIGSLLLKPGRSYEVLKSDGLTLLITVTPEPDK